MSILQRCQWMDSFAQRMITVFFALNQWQCIENNNLFFSIFNDYVGKHSHKPGTMTFPKSACAKQKDIYSKTENKIEKQTSLVTMCSQEKLTHDSSSVVLGLSVVWIWMKCLRIRQPRNTTHFQFTLMLWRKTVLLKYKHFKSLKDIETHWMTLKLKGLQT